MTMQFVDGGRSLFTSESVTEGHPDKICDQISDAILDDILSKDPLARVACEIAVTTGLVLVMGEVTTTAVFDVQAIVRQAIRDIGYTRAKYGFDSETCAVLTSLHSQSPDIAMGVDRAVELRQSQTVSDRELDLIGAGDQGLMFGYASDETPEYMPMPIALAHKLARRLAEVRKSEEITYLRPDGKTQVTVEYSGGRAIRIDTIVVSTQHDPDVEHAVIEADVVEKVVKPVIPVDFLDDETRYYINPTGRFVVGGPAGDSGLTGRKIIVDTYGGMGRHGGGALSGKDATKVDRSGAYAARWVAKNIVAAGLAGRCEVQVAYAIGVAKPVSFMAETFGTGLLPDSVLGDIAMSVFDLRPAAIINKLDLRRPIFRLTSVYGHFGRTDVDLPWERLDMVDSLREHATNRGLTESAGRRL